MIIGNLPTLDILNDDGVIVYSDGGDELYRVKKKTFLKGMTGGSTYYGTNTPGDDLGKDGDFYCQVALPAAFPDITVGRHGTEEYTLPAEESTDSTEHTGTLPGWSDQMSAGYTYISNNGSIDSFSPIMLRPAPVLETYIQDKKYIQGGQQGYTIENVIEGIEMQISFDVTLVGDVQFSTPSGGDDDFYGVYFPSSFPPAGDPDELGPIFTISDDTPFGEQVDLASGVSGVRFYKDKNTHRYTFNYITSGDYFNFAFNFGGVYGDFKTGGARILVSTISLSPVQGYNNIVDIYIKSAGRWVKDEYAKKDDFSVTDLAQTGELIATINYDGSSYPIKAPIPGGTHVSVEQVVHAGTKIATITLNDVPTDIFAPAGDFNCGSINGVYDEDSSGNPLVTTGSYEISGITLKKSDGVTTYTTGTGLYLLNFNIHLIQDDEETINVSGGEVFTIRLYSGGGISIPLAPIFKQRADIYNGESFDCCYEGTAIAYVANNNSTPTFVLTFNGSNFTTGYTIEECRYSITMYKIGEY